MIAKIQSKSDKKILQEIETIIQSQNGVEDTKIIM